MSKKNGTPETRARLYKLIDGSGGQDKYIDAEEEEMIFEKAEELEIWRGQAEAMLNHRCKQHGWTRESEVSYYLTVMLEEATKDDGVIDKKEFDHILGFATAVRMPRRDAIRKCCAIVRERGWETENEGLLKRSDWLAEYEAKN